jgi:hypothetical protein
MSPKPLRLIGDFRVVQVVDLMKEEPTYRHEISYSRLQGFRVSDEELWSLLRQVESSGSSEAYGGSHYLRMVDPAPRLIRMHRRGHKPEPDTLCQLMWTISSITYILHSLRASMIYSPKDLNKNVRSYIDNWISLNPRIFLTFSPRHFLCTNS